MPFLVPSSLLSEIQEACGPINNPLSIALQQISEHSGSFSWQQVYLTRKHLLFPARPGWEAEHPLVLLLESTPCPERAPVQTSLEGHPVR